MGPRRRGLEPGAYGAGFPRGPGSIFSIRQPTKVRGRPAVWTDAGVGYRGNLFQPDSRCCYRQFCDMRHGVKGARQDWNAKECGQQGRDEIDAKKAAGQREYHGTAVDDETRRRECHVGSDAGDGAEEEESTRPEMTHKEPSYKNARWLRKRPGAPRWTQKLCRLLEDLMEADETEEETGVGAIVYEIWKILLDCDKSGKGALKSKIKEHKKQEKDKEKTQRKKERRKGKKGTKTSRRGKGRCGSSAWTSSSSDSSSSDSDTGSSSSWSSSSSGCSTRRTKDRGGQKGAPQPEFKWIDGKRHFKSKKSGDWVCCEGPAKSASSDCGGHHW